MLENTRNKRSRTMGAGQNKWNLEKFSKQFQQIIISVLYKPKKWYFHFQWNGRCSLNQSCHMSLKAKLRSFTPATRIYLILGTYAILSTCSSFLRHSGSGQHAKDDGKEAGAFGRPQKRGKRLSPRVRLNDCQAGGQGTGERFCQFSTPPPSAPASHPPPRHISFFWHEICI